MSKKKNGLKSAAKALAKRSSTAKKAAGGTPSVPRTSTTASSPGFCPFDPDGGGASGRDRGPLSSGDSPRPPRRRSSVFSVPARFLGDEAATVDRINEELGAMETAAADTTSKPTPPSLAAVAGAAAAAEDVRRRLDVATALLESAKKTLAAKERELRLVLVREQGMCNKMRRRIEELQDDAAEAADKAAAGDLERAECKRRLATAEAASELLVKERCYALLGEVSLRAAAAADPTEVMRWAGERQAQLEGGKGTGGEPLGGAARPERKDENASVLEKLKIDVATLRLSIRQKDRKILTLNDEVLTLAARAEHLIAPELLIRARAAVLSAARGFRAFAAAVREELETARASIADAAAGAVASGLRPIERAAACLQSRLEACESAAAAAAAEREAAAAALRRALGAAPAEVRKVLQPLGLQAYADAAEEGGPVQEDTAAPAAAAAATVEEEGEGEAAASPPSRSPSQQQQQQQAPSPSSQPRNQSLASLSPSSPPHSQPCPPADSGPECRAKHATVAAADEDAEGPSSSSSSSSAPTVAWSAVLGGLPAADAARLARMLEAVAQAAAQARAAALASDAAASALCTLRAAHAEELSGVRREAAVAAAGAQALRAEAAELRRGAADAESRAARAEAAAAAAGGTREREARALEGELQRLRGRLAWAEGEGRAEAEAAALRRLDEEGGGGQAVAAAAVEDALSEEELFGLHSQCDDVVRRAGRMPERCGGAWVCERVAVLRECAGGGVAAAGSWKAADSAAYALETLSGAVGALERLYEGGGGSGGGGTLLRMPSLRLAPAEHKKALDMLEYRREKYKARLRAMRRGGGPAAAELVALRRMILLEHAAAVQGRRSPRYVRWLVEKADCLQDALAEVALTRTALADPDPEAFVGPDLLSIPAWRPGRSRTTPHTKEEAEEAAAAERLQDGDGGGGGVRVYPFPVRGSSAKVAALLASASSAADAGEAAAAGEGNGGGGDVCDQRVRTAAGITFDQVRRWSSDEQQQQQQQQAIDEAETTSHPSPLRRESQQQQALRTPSPRALVAMMPGDEAAALPVLGVVCGGKEHPPAGAAATVCAAEAATAAAAAVEELSLCRRGSAEAASALPQVSAAAAVNLATVAITLPDDLTKPEKAPKPVVLGGSREEKRLHAPKLVPATPMPRVGSIAKHRNSVQLPRVDACVPSAATLERAEAILARRVVKPLDDVRPRRPSKAHFPLPYNTKTALNSTPVSASACFSLC